MLNVGPTYTFTLYLQLFPAQYYLSGPSTQLTQVDMSLESGLTTHVVMDMKCLVLNRIMSHSVIKLVNGHLTL